MARPIPVTEPTFSAWTMPKIIILYWEPGSCGDFVQSLLLSRPQYQGVVEKFDSDDLGRIKPTVKTLFKNTFQHEPTQWYQRQWSEKDLEQLSQVIKNIECEYFVIPTHRLDQITTFKTHFDNCTGVGITYPANMFLFVLKNMCKKVVPDSHVLNNFFDARIHQYFKNNNSFGEFVFKQQLRHGSTIAKLVDCQFDVNVCLENLLSGNLNDLIGLLPGLSATDIGDWLQKQNVLYRFNFGMNPTLQSILGYNSKSTPESNLKIELDNFDRILISEFFKMKNIPVRVFEFDTLDNVNNFFEVEKL